jgi:hypothetical protein
MSRQPTPGIQVECHWNTDTLEFYINEDNLATVTGEYQDVDGWNNVKRSYYISMKLEDAKVWLEQSLEQVNRRLSG